MEELFARFPHLSEKIFLKLSYQSLVTCREVSRSWNETIETERSSYLKIIKRYTKCSDELLRKILNKCKAPIVLVSILIKIFRNFPKGTKQSHQYLKIWGNTPLHIAAGNGHVAAYHLLMDNVEDKNPMGKNLAHIKIKGDSEQKPKQLRCRSSEANEYTPLHFAVRNGHFSTCKLIVENVEEKNPPNSGLYTPLHCAAATGNYSIFKMIIENVKGNKNPRDVSGNTPLHIAAAYGHFSICYLILSYKEVAKSLIETRQETVCHLAAANGQINIYKLLMDRKLHGIFLKNSWGQVPLHHAAKYGHLDICKLILENTENKDICNLQDNLGNSPLSWAIRNQHTEIINYFMAERGQNKMKTLSPLKLEFGYGKFQK